MPDTSLSSAEKRARELIAAKYGKEYLPEKLQGKKFYEPQGQGYEKSINERLQHLKKSSTSRKG